MNHNIKKGMAALLCLAVLVGCASRASDQAEPAPLVEEEIDVTAQLGLLEQLDGIYAQFDTTPLALQGVETYAALDSFDGVQLVNEDDTAKKLARAVYNLLDAYGNGLGSYADAQELSLARTTTALFHTAPIDFTWEMNREGAFTPSDPKHVLAALIKREIESGRLPVAAYYADEVKKTAAALFGEDARLTNQDIFPYYYYEKEGVYLLMEELQTGESAVPQILSYEKTQDGYTAEVVLVQSVGGKLQLNGEALEKGNFTEKAAQEPRLRYTFVESGERLVLKSLEVKRPGQ